MNIDSIHNLLQDFDLVDIDESTDAALKARIEPLAARRLWQLLLSVNGTDERFHIALQWILESVLVDQISNRILGDDEFALIIGNRISVLLEQMIRVQNEQRGCAA